MKNQGADGNRTSYRCCGWLASTLSATRSTTQNLSLSEKAKAATVPSPENATCSGDSLNDVDSAVDDAKFLLQIAARPRLPESS
ncbi:MAG: hypothetical protein ABGZ23_28695 [Fuerstiella sp.]|nr:hypothetical protein [Fuerstiella sp.]